MVTPTLTPTPTPAGATVSYPESDGQPVAETDVHRTLMFELIGMLQAFFRADPQVYISGNLFVYYQEGNPRRVVAPDVFVVQGVRNRQRRIYKLWEEGVVPAVVFELTSRSTRREDLRSKYDLYERLGCGSISCSTRSANICGRRAVATACTKVGTGRWWRRRMAHCGVQC